MLATKPSADTGEIADLRLHAMHEGGQIVVRLAPDGVELPANDGPGRNRLGRGRDLQRVLLQGLDQGPDGVAQRTHQDRDGHDEHGDPEQHQQGRAEPVASAEMGRDAQVQGVEGHREDHGPDREREEGGQDAVAEQRHGEEKSGTDQHLEQAVSEASFEVRVGCGERRHDGSLVLGFADSRQAWRACGRKYRVDGVAGAGGPAAAFCCRSRWWNGCTELPLRQGSFQGATE